MVFIFAFAFYFKSHHSDLIFKPETPNILFWNILNN